MLRRAFAAVCLLLCLAVVATPARGQGDDETPLLRLEPGGPTARVNAVAFSPDGRTLYGAGLDKVVRCWTRNDRGQFVPSSTAFRVPVGDGTVGAINCLAVSPDGRWLAASGLGLTRLEADLRHNDRVFDVTPTWTPALFRERSLIYVFPLRPGRPQADEVRVLRGHEGPVLALAFAPADPAGQAPPVLVSAARDRWGDQAAPGGDVRVWDVGKAGAGAQLAQLPLARVGQAERVGLAVRRAGRGATQLHMALAWGDGRLLVWDVASGREPRAVPDGRDPVNQSAAYLPALDGRVELLTGSYGRLGGQLQRWSDPPAADPEATLPLGRSEDGKNYGVPCALALASSGEARGLDLAAVVVQVAGAGGSTQTWLRLLDLVPRHAVNRPFFLWGGSTRKPALAASPDGRFLAVTHSDRPEILVYSVEQLLKAPDPAAARPQRLRGVGATVHSVAFVRKAGVPVPGLLLGVTLPDGRAGEQSLVFDFAGRKVVGPAEQQGWQVVRPAWGAKAVPPRGQESAPVFAWEGGGRQGRLSVPLQRGEEVTATALIPPVAGVATVPILAVAAYGKFTAEPRLALYNADTGEQVRQLFGHVAVIHSLAVTPDGRLLASAAEDETVCLWSMTDLNAILGRHGALDGVQFRQDDKGAAVLRVTDPRAAGGLRAGDRVTGVTLQGDKQPRPVGSVLDLFNEVWRARPGDPVRLRLEREGKPAQTGLTVRQGVEAKAPLLSLFLAGREGAEPGWIAWTPSGHFDASGPDVEQYVGWQFNPARPGEQRIRFAPLNEYRERFYEKLLLKHLVAAGSLDAARDAIARLRAIPRPELTLSVAGAEQAAKGPREALLVPDPEAKLRLTVEGPSLARGEVESVLLESDDKTESLNLKDVSGQTLSVPVTLAKRRDRTFTVTVRTQEGLHEAKRDVTLRYQPPPPVVELEGLPAERKVVRVASFALHAHIRPAATGQGVRVSGLELNGKPLRVPTGLDFERALPLIAGENELVVEAANADAPPGDAAAETTRVARTLVFDKEQTPQPQFTEVESVARGAARSARHQARASGLVTVDTRQVRLLGTVTARQPLKEVNLRIGTEVVAAQGKRGDNRFDLDHTLALEPGKEVRLTLEARTENSDVGKAGLRLKYVPALPDLEVTGPADNEAVIDRDQRGFADIDLRGMLRPASDFYPFEVDVWVSNRDKAGPGVPARAPNHVVRFTKEEQVPADWKPRRLAGLRLGPGSNRLVVQVKNDYQTGDPEVRYLAYRQPPRVVGPLLVPAKVPRPFAEVKARVESPSDLPLTEVVVNGKPYDVRQVATRQPGPRDGVSAWDVIVKEVALGDEGKNPVLLRVRNQDGTDEKRAEVVVSVPPPPRPKIEIVNGPKDGNVTRSPFPLEVRVESVSALTALRLVQGPTSRDLHAEKRVAQPQGFYEWKGSVPVDLNEGDNALAIEAVNAGGGVERVPLRLTYVPRPVQLLLEPLAPAVDGAHVRLKGTVLWREPQQARRVLGQLSQIKVYVNDLLQAPPRPLRRDPSRPEQPFVVDLILNRENNNIQVECPFPLEDESRSAARVVCKKPLAPGTLRVLLVNAGAETVGDDDLIRRARSALQLEGRDGSTLGSQVFPRAVLYPNAGGRPSPLSRRVTREKVRYWLQAIQQDVERDGRSPGARPGDVVLIYWLGKDLVADEKGDWYLPTSDSEREPEKSPAVTGQSLRLLLDDDHDVPGARLLLLDLAGTGDGGDPEADWARSRAGVLRYRWAGDAVPGPGLLDALVTAAERRGPVSLGDWTKTAGEIAGRLTVAYHAALRLTERLPASLARLVVVQPPGK